MLSFCQFVQLDEDLSKTELTPANHHFDGAMWHGWTLHHPEYGKLAKVDVYSTDDKPMQHAKSASIDVDVYDNPKVPEHEKSTVPWSNTGNQVPAYKLGASHTRKLLRQLKAHYPNLETIHDASRVTGARQKNQTFKTTRIQFRPDHS